MDGECEKSHWDRLPLQLQDYTEEMAARQIHRERLEKVHDELLRLFYRIEKLKEY